MGKTVNKGMKRKEEEKSTGKRKGVKNPPEHEISSRCSVKKLHEVMISLEEKMTDAQKEGIRRTPFYHIGQTDVGNASMAQLKALVDCYNRETECFDLSDCVSISFEEWEFSVVMGLRSRGLNVHPKLVEKSRILDKYFGGDERKVVKKKIVEVLTKLAGSSADRDFVSVYVLLVFNTVLFADANSRTPGYVIHYVDDLERLGEYGWGKAVHTFMVKAIEKHHRERTKHVNGCTVGLMGWLYKRVPTLAKSPWKHRMSGFTKWIEVHDKLSACKDRLRAVRRGEVDDFQLLVEEQYLVGDICPRPLSMSQPVSMPRGKKVNNISDLFKCNSALVSIRLESYGICEHKSGK